MKVEQGRRVAVEGEEREEREKEREIIQLHRLCSRSQTIYVCKEQKGKKKQGKKRRKERKERRDEHNGEGNR